MSHFHEFLNADNAVVVFVDHQAGLYSGVRDSSILELKHNVRALAQAAQALSVTIVVTTNRAEGLLGPLISELAEVLPKGLQVVDRSVINAWSDSRVRAQVEASGRRKVIWCGITLEVCAALPAIAAAGSGYDTYVAVDASGTLSRVKHQAGIVRLQQAGVIVSDYATLMVEILADNASPAAAAVYKAIDMPFNVVLDQISAGFQKNG